MVGWIKLHFPWIKDALCHVWLKLEDMWTSVTFFKLSPHEEESAWPFSNSGEVKIWWQTNFDQNLVAPVNQWFFIFVLLFTSPEEPVSAVGKVLSNLPKINRHLSAIPCFMPTKICMGETLMQFKFPLHNFTCLAVVIWYSNIYKKLLMG